MSLWGLIAWIGAAISWWGTAKYMISIGRGNTQPRLASWIAWGTANSVLMTVALLHGMHTAAIFNGLAALGNISVLVLSAIKRAGQRPSGSTDWICLLASGVCLLVILLFPHAAVLGAVLAMSANVIATWPTLMHAWQRPHEEAWQLFAANGGANALGLIGVFAAAGASLGNIAGPLISMVGNVSLVVITIGRSWLRSTVRTIGEEVTELVEEVGGVAGGVAEAIEELEYETVTQPALASIAIEHQRTVSSRRRKQRLIRTY